MNNTKKNIDQEYIELWELSDCESIYNGRYSRCYKKNNIVRKYYRYNNLSKFTKEFKTMKSAYQQGVFTPEPIALEYDKYNDKWYIESKFVVFDKLDSNLNLMMFNQLLELIKKMQKIKYRNESNWLNLLGEFDDALITYSEFYKEECRIYMNMLNSLNAECFIHGDFLPKNMGVTPKGLVVFDFQNSGYGPYNWDLWYFLSEFDPAAVEDNVFRMIDKIWLEFICIILKIRMGRAIKKNQPIKKYQLRLEKWRLLFEKK